ncbi:MAG: pilus assembly FimT family protein, partial [Planctomycetota bacterium]
LVVLGIIALLSSMIFLVPESNTADKVKSDARLLAATLEQARTLAMKTGAIHGVVFHIQNAGDGSVLRNSSSADGDLMTQGGEVVPVDEHNRHIAERQGHWYALIGPDPSDPDGLQRPPEVFSGSINSVPRPYLFPPEFRDAVKRAIVGEPVFLQQGVRFLALSDWDLGSAGWVGGIKTYLNGDYPFGLAADHYPRPWCGVWDGDRVWAWGGYDREVEDGAEVGETGFCYQGPHVTNPSPSTATRYYDPELDTNLYGEEWIAWDFNHLAQGPGDVGERLNGSLDYRSHVTPAQKTAYGWDENTTMTGPSSALMGEPKPLLDAYVIDYAIYFRPDGSAMVVDSVGRNVYSRYRNLVHTWHDLQGSGGVTITIAEDVDPLRESGGAPVYDTSLVADSGSIDFTTLPSLQAWVDRLGSFRRITVGLRSGSVEVKDEDHPDCKLLNDSGDAVDPRWTKAPL